MPDAYLTIGEIVRPQGVKGELKARPITVDPARFFQLTSVFVLEQGEYRPRAVRVRSAGDDAVIFAMEGVSTREQAEAMRGTLLYVDRAHAVPLGPEENFLVDLIGCEAEDDSGRALGTVAEVLQPGGNDVYVLRGPLGEILVPALKSVVLRVDVNAKKMLLDARRLAEVAVFPDSEIVR